MVRRIDKVTRGREVRLRVDGREVVAHEGESLAAALAAAGFVHLRDSPEAGTPRGMVCLMGVCQECVVRLDGRVAASCMQVVQGGLEVELLRRPDGGSAP